MVLKQEVRVKVLPETKKRIDELAQKTHRQQGNVIDAAIELFYQNQFERK
jgi:predicted transcriptional regulator